MAPQNQAQPDPIQARVFYTPEWTMEVDNRFIQLLLEEKRAGTFSPSGCNSRAVRTAMHILNLTMGSSFDYEFCKDRVKKLHKRYKAFNWILGVRDVTYDPVAHIISCEESVWEYITQNERLAIAYRSRSEVLFEALHDIFQEDEDSVGWNQLEDITHISSDLKTISIPEGVQFPRYEEKSTDQEWWNKVACPSSSSIFANSCSSGSVAAEKRSVSCVSIPSTSKTKVAKSSSSVSF